MLAPVLLFHLIWRMGKTSICILNHHMLSWRPEGWRRVESNWANRMCLGTGPQPTSALLNSTQGVRKESQPHTTLGRSHHQMHLYKREDEAVSEQASKRQKQKRRPCRAPHGRLTSQLSHGSALALLEIGSCLPSRKPSNAWQRQPWTSHFSRPSYWNKTWYISYI